MGVEDSSDESRKAHTCTGGGEEESQVDEVMGMQQNVTGDDKDDEMRHHEMEDDEVGIEDDNVDNDEESMIRMSRGMEMREMKRGQDAKLI